METKSPAQYRYLFMLQRPGGMLLLLLSRLGHDLSVREDLARFVVAAHTGDVLPRLIWYVTLVVIQHDDILHWWQKLKLALWFPPVISFKRGRGARTRTFGFGFGTAGLDGAHERREGHLAVLRWAKWCCVFGSCGCSGGPLGERCRCGELGPVEILCRHHLAGVPHFRPEARYCRRRRRARRGGGGGQGDGAGAAGCFARGQLAFGAVCGFLCSLGCVGVLVGCFERWACEPGGLAGWHWCLLRWWWWWWERRGG